MKNEERRQTLNASGFSVLSLWYFSQEERRVEKREEMKKMGNEILSYNYCKTKIEERERVLGRKKPINEKDERNQNDKVKKTR